MISLAAMTPVRRFNSGLAAAFSAALLAACSSAIEGGIAEPPPTGGPTLAITAAGVGGLDASTTYSEASIEAVMPGFDAEPVTMATEQSTVSALALFRNGLQVLQVLPGEDGRIGAVHGVSASLRGPGGSRIGMSLEEARLPAGSCREGTGNWLGMPICSAPGAPNVTYVFAIPGYADPNGLPDDATLATATLQRIIWTPAGTAS